MFLATRQGRPAVCRRGREGGPDGTCDAFEKGNAIGAPRIPIRFPPLLCAQGPKPPGDPLVYVARRSLNVNRYCISAKIPSRPWGS